MFKLNKVILGLAAFVAPLAANHAMAVDTPLVGTVESRCTVTTDTMGIYGNPLPYKLSTAGADAGVEPVIRYDVVQASYYKAYITHPISFSESPALSDTTQWTGDVSVKEVSDAQMSSYDTDKIEYDNVTEIALAYAGSTWFKVESQVEYGYQKSWPAGTYRAIVQAECIAI
mgnify:CR=1 FL=1|tara:strand:- start:589 stop:1104 length:516 start_codon:yes stop_codon:yes gene_type:complete